MNVGQINKASAMRLNSHALTHPTANQRFFTLLGAFVRGTKIETDNQPMISISHQRNVDIADEELRFVSRVCRD